MRHKAIQHGLNWIVDSAGTGFWHVGELPDRRSIATAREHGIDITGQRARQFEAADLERFDRIFVMDTQNLRDVLRHADDGERREKVSLILDHLYPGQQRSVPDPYYDDDGFEEVFRMLDDACESFIRDHLEAST